MTLHPPADPARFARFHEEQWEYMRRALGWTGTEEELLEGLKRLARENGTMKRPKIVCLCGSTRFTEQMLIKQWELTKAGNIVLSWCALPDSYFQTEDRFHIGDQEGVKAIVDELHLRKIDLADEVLALNVDGYVGESTTREIKYALRTGKGVRWLDGGKIPAWVHEYKGEGD